MSRQLLQSSLVIAWFCIAVAAQNPQPSCPVISIEGPSGMLGPKQPGIFRVKVVGSQDVGKLSFRWASTVGKISGEFGSSTTQLLTEKRDGGSNIAVFVRVEGLPEGCPDTASEIIGTIPIVEGDPVDRFGVLKRNEVKARMDNFYISLKSNAAYTGLIDLYFGPRESRAARLARINTILETIRFRKFDIGRVEFAFIESEQSETVLWLVFPGTDPADLLESRPNSVFVQGPDVMKDPKKALPKRHCLCK